VDWPTSSPDLSSIELLWVIRKKMARRIQPQTTEKLKNELVAAWTLIPQITIDQLCQEFQAQ
jgi:transposase